MISLDRPALVSGKLGLDEKTVFNVFQFFPINNVGVNWNTFACKAFEFSNRHGA